MALEQYTPEERAAILAAEKRADLVRDAERQKQYDEYRKEREAQIEARRQLNPDLAARLAEIRKRMEGGDA